MDASIITINIGLNKRDKPKVIRFIFFIEDFFDNLFTSGLKIKNRISVKRPMYGMDHASKLIPIINSVEYIEFVLGTKSAILNFNQENKYIPNIPFFDSFK